jgi:ParB family chromosome partitioning protein
LNLPERVKAYINSGKLTAGHARMLVGQPNAEELADQIVNQGLNVRQVEAMARKSGRGQARAVKRTGRLGKDADTEALENRLTNALGLLVTIDHRANGGGMLQVRYRTLEQLDDVIARLEAGPKIPAGDQPEDASKSGFTGGPRIRRT